MSVSTYRDKEAYMCYLRACRPNGRQALYHPNGGTKMHRSKPRMNKSRNAFKRRANKTHRLNIAQPLRGGIRL